MLPCFFKFKPICLAITSYVGSHIIITSYHLHSRYNPSPISFFKYASTPFFN